MKRLRSLAEQSNIETHNMLTFALSHPLHRTHYIAISDSDNAALKLSLSLLKHISNVDLPGRPPLANLVAPI